MKPISRMESDFEAHAAVDAAAVGPRVLLAEDDIELRLLLACVIRSAGYDVIAVANGYELVEYLQSVRAVERAGEPIDLVVSDIRMPWVSGLDVLDAMRRGDWATPIVLMTAFGDAATHAEALRLGASVVIDKPFDVGALIGVIRDLVEPARATG